MQTKKKDFGFIFWIHLFLILFWYISPFLFSWYFLLFGVAFSYLQGFVINGCILTHAQFGKETEVTFWSYYLEKIGVRMDRRLAKIIFFWIEPLAVFIIGVLWQKVFGMNALLI